MYRLIVTVLLLGALVLAKNDNDPILFLHKYGYINPGRSSAKSISNAIKDFQIMANLPPTGILDQITRTQMNKPRCGFTDSLAVKSKMAYFGAWTKWNTRHITYRYDSTYRGMNTVTMKSIIKLAFKAWSDVTPLTFTETTGKATMTIGFKRGYHYDGNGFDGLGGVLAHAFFPTDGRIHFDSDERWTSGRTTQGSRQTSLFYTAAHEIGHALGLPHINNGKALMYPYHIDFGNRFQFKLPQADVNNIKKLYGGKTTTPTGPIKPTNKKCYNNHRYCHLWKYRCNFDPIVIKGCRQTCNRCS